MVADYTPNTTLSIKLFGTAKEKPRPESVGTQDAALYLCVGAQVRAYWLVIVETIIFAVF